MNVRQLRTADIRRVGTYVVCLVGPEMGLSSRDIRPTSKVAHRETLRSVAKHRKFGSSHGMKNPSPCREGVVDPGASKGHARPFTNSEIKLAAGPKCWPKKE